ncbi:MAG: hypothetical protein KAR84_00305 [Elusimicrobiales bacterium]|nr:hypothetical protein [Elusimicrobiales bacterium]MCK5358879.1 hypothetical protein [Elusimicrobiales bacterium]MCK5582698.1 hypothetical protein [Elusimicrobiales bacterium]
MDLIFAFASNDGKTLNMTRHFGDSNYYLFYKISPTKTEFLEKRESAKFEEEESIKHGDPSKARGIGYFLKDADVLVSKIFGPNINRMIKKFSCVLVQSPSIEENIKSIQNNMDKIVEELKKGEDRKHLILKD